MNAATDRADLAALVRHAMVLCEVDDPALAGALDACRCAHGPDAPACPHVRAALGIARERLGRDARLNVEVGTALGHDAHGLLANAVVWALQGRADLASSCVRLALVRAVLARDSQRVWARAERAADAVLAGLRRRYAHCA